MYVMERLVRCMLWRVYIIERLTESLFAHIFFSNWSASFFQTATVSSGSLIRYKRDASTDKTTVASAQSLLKIDFAWWIKYNKWTLLAMIFICVFSNTMFARNASYSIIN